MCEPKSSQATKNIHSKHLFYLLSKKRLHHKVHHCLSFSVHTSFYFPGWDFIGESVISISSARPNPPKQNQRPRRAEDRDYNTVSRTTEVRTFRIP